jgi:hypothetical protein
MQSLGRRGWKEARCFTMRFSFRRDGSIFGHPLPAIIDVIGD